MWSFFETKAGGAYPLFDGLLFDLDGTLWDSVDAICLSWNSVLERRNPQLAGLVTRENVTGCMGMLLPDIVKKLVPDIPKEEIRPLLDELLVVENDYVATHGGVLYPQVEETLECLSRDYPLFIVSNCQAGYIEAFFQAHGLGRFFKDFENPGRTGKPKGDNIALVVQRNGLKNPLYIGDTQGDYNAATQAGVPFLHAAYGFGHIDHEVPHVDAFADLPAAVERLSPP